VEAPEEKPVVVLNDCGAVSEVTRGQYALWPWTEITPPPFDHYCPVCTS
jgi:hypothetical protein